LGAGFEAHKTVPGNLDKNFLLLEPPNYQNYGKLNVFGVTLKQAGVCVVLVSSTATAVISSWCYCNKKTKIKTQLIILTLERFGRFGIEITGHYVFTGWIPPPPQQQQQQHKHRLL